MSKSIGLEALISKREELVNERDSMLAEFNSEITEMESCIQSQHVLKFYQFPPVNLPE